MLFGTKSSGLIIKDGLKIEGCKIEGLLYSIPNGFKTMQFFRSTCMNRTIMSIVLQDNYINTTTGQFCIRVL